MEKQIVVEIGVHILSLHILEAFILVCVGTVQIESSLDIFTTLHELIDGVQIVYLSDLLWIFNVEYDSIVTNCHLQ